MIPLVLLSNHRIIANSLFQMPSKTILFQTGKLEHPNVRACQRIPLVRMARVNMQMAMKVNLLMASMSAQMANMAVTLARMGLTLDASLLKLKKRLP